MGDMKREIQHLRQQRKLGGGQMAQLALILNAPRLSCVCAVLLGTGNQILFAFSFAGRGHTHLRQTSGSPVLVQGL